MMASLGLVSHSVSAQSLFTSPPVATPSLISPSAGVNVPRSNVNVPLVLNNAARLRAAAALAHSASAADRASMLQRASALGIPKSVKRPNGRVVTLVGITSLNEPLYVEPADISSADTIGVDQLWPANVITAYTGFPGWTTGATGYNLSGSGVPIAMWEAAVNAAGDSAVLTTHDQFTNGAGGSRVTQSDFAPSGPSFHATEVAGVLASAGIDAYVNFNGHISDFGNESRGMAYASTVNAYDLTDVQGTFLGEAGIGTRLGNNSYGQVAGWVNQGTVAAPQWHWYGTGTSVQDWKFGAYLGAASGTAPAELDADSYFAPNTLMVFAAGNDHNVGPGGPVTYYLGATGTTPQTATRNWLDGDASGYDSLPPSACAKNVLTVGATYDVQGGYTNPASVTMASFSSVGPTDDGRIKPDIVAEGIRSGTGTHNPFGIPGMVVPTFDINNPTANNFYGLDAGTSFSAPSVTGALALLLQKRAVDRPEWNNNGYPGLSSTWRGLAIHTADQVGANPGPSFTAGYGLLNAVRATTLLHNDITSGTNPAGNGPKPFIKEVQMQNGSSVQFNATAVSSSTPLKVTICWIDPAGAAQTNNSVDQQTKRLVNDLDVRVYPPGTTTFDPAASTTAKPWILTPDLTNQSATVRAAAATTGDDSTNNVEQIVINNPVTTGPYIVRVTNKGNLTDGHGNMISQWVSIIVSGNTVPAVPAFNLSITNLGNNNFLLTWPAVVGGVYQFQGASSLFGPWTNIGNPISANIENMSYLVTAPAGSSMGFWRAGRLY